MRLPPSAKNWISLAGATIAVVALFMILFLFAVTVILEEQAAYLGLVVYILLPGVMLAGLILIAVGMVVKSRKARQAHEEMEAGWPRVDLNDPRHRNAAFIFVFGTGIFLFISAIGSYQAFHFTESTYFCGQMCHAVMEPEAVAHVHGPHARVDCVACHVGPGVDWYVRSKISGLYQVYAVAMRNYPRPIPTPIEELRPARDTCEQCHWPEQFYSYRYRERSYFLAEEDNPRWDLGLTLKVGNPHPAIGFEEGIHWHINPKVHIEYAPTDASRMEIAWVRYTNLETGEVKVYREDGYDERDLEVRVMDCMDCHNRPAHQYLSPNVFIDKAMMAGTISPELPGIKALALNLSSQHYDSRDEAMDALRAGIEEHYGRQHPQIMQERPEVVERAIVTLQESFARNIFPYMRARWDVYPDHSAHLEFPGCFRCHNDRHATETGEVIRMDCVICHDINSQGFRDAIEFAPIGKSLEFEHPVDIGDAWREVLCSDCHGG